MFYHILPSILAADPLCLGEEVSAVLRAGADMLHLDVMDNHYVPCLSYGPSVCQSMHARFSQVVIDVHLMTSPVDNLIEQFAKAGAARISIHPQASIHLNRSLQFIAQLGCKAGLVLNPAASLDCLLWSVSQLDFVMVMTVNPGFGGQKLIPEMIKKIAAIHAQYPHLPICVDGGVCVGNIARLAAAGATEFVVGSALFTSSDYTQSIAEMRQQLRA